MSTIFVSLLQINFLYFVFIGFHQYFLPPNMNTILARKLIKYSVTANNNEIMVVFYLESCNIWVSNNNIWVSFVFFDFCFNITDCFWHWESTRKNSVWTINNLFTCFSKSWIRLNYLWVLINSTSILYDSLHLKFICWFMISAQQE